MADETTPLPAGKEAEFQQWLRRNNVRDLDHPDSHYDYRGAFLAGIGRGGDTGHFPDTFKQHGHPTFSEESRYSKGHGDGGTWDGEKFTPGKPMTEPAPYLPGKPIGYGLNPGMHHNVMTGQDDYAIPDNPLDVPEPGDQPGPAPAAAAPPSPEAAPAPAPEAPHPFTPPVGSESKGPIVGWRVRDKEGHVVAELHNVNTSEWQKSQIDSVGKSLLDQAITPDDKESAQRARAYALSLVGIVPLEKITKTMLQLYENDQRNLTSRSIQAEKSKRAAMRGSGGPAVGPTKADKFQVGLDKELRSTVDGVIESERKDSKHAALAQLDNDVSEMESLLSAPNAMAQRVAVQKALLALTGKASRESEQAALTGASGKWEEFKNKISLWTSDDPQLGAKYIQEFKQMLRVQRQYVNQQRQMAGKAAAERVRAETFGYPDDQRQLAYDIAYGAMTGQYAGAASAPAPKAAKPPAAAPKGGGFDPDL